MIAIYTRQSIDKKDSISIKTQIELCKKELKKDEVFKLYEDKGFSGRNIERPSFKNLLEDVKNGLIKKIIVYKLDRISRSITDFSKIIEFLEKYKVSFISASEKFDTSSPTGRAMLYIIMVFAQLERETIAERIKDNYYSRGKTGVWLGGKAPFGFKNKKILLNGKKVPTIEETEDIKIVKEIFNLYSNTNFSLGTIAKYLLKKYNSSMWNNIKLSRILRNPAYVKSNIDVYEFFKAKHCIITNKIEEFQGENGCILYGKKNNYKDYKNMYLSISNHIGIIEPSVWLNCQKKLEENKQIKNLGKGKHTFLTGFIKCGYCGYSMNVKKYKETKYFSCTGRYITNLCVDKINTHYVNEIEDYILREISFFLHNFKSLKLESKTFQNKNEMNNLKINLHKIENEIKTLINSLNNANEVLIKYVNEKIVCLDKEKLNLLKIIKEKNRINEKLEMPNLENLNSLNLEIKKVVVSKLIDKVEVFNDNIKIKWKI